MRSILVTGCAGFIGSNFVPYFMDRYPDYKIINLDLLTYAGDLNNLSEVEENEKYTFIKGNICLSLTPTTFKVLSILQQKAMLTTLSKTPVSL
jgi:dTDP-glucose 4,6-dehydratase